VRGETQLASIGSSVSSMPVIGGEGGVMTSSFSSSLSLLGGGIRV